MVAKLQFPVDPEGGTYAFGTIFQGYRGLRDVVISGSSYVGQEELSIPSEISKKVCGELCFKAETCLPLGLYWKGGVM